MGVAKAGESDDVLESFHEGLVSNSTLMEIVRRVDVSNNVGKAVVSLELEKLLLKPSDLVAWITSIFKKVPIHVIASLSVETNDLAFSVWKWL